MSEAVVDRLIGLASLAPSRFNLQPTRFLVVRDPLNRRKLRRCAFGDSRITEAPVVVVVLAYFRAHVTDLETVAGRMVALEAATEAEAKRLRTTATRTLGRSGDLAPESWAIRESALASMTLLIAAESLGLASASLEGFDPAQIRAGFGVPDDHAICGLIALGYADRPAPFPGRFGTDHVAYSEHFGRPWKAEDEGGGPLDSGGPAG